MKLTISHKASSVIHDPEFISWVVNPTKESDSYWNRYLQENPEKKAEVQEARFLIRSFVKNDESLSDREVSDLWTDILQSTIIRKKKAIILRRLLAAASVCLIISLSALISIHIISSKSRSNLMTGIPSTDKEVKLILPDNKVRCFSSKEVALKYDEKGDIVTATGTAFNSESSGIKESPGNDMNKLIVPFGRRSNIILSDGTKLWLNSGSYALFPSTFDKDQRRIFIEGEAYIEVTKNHEKPFYVESNDITVKVLGTKFNIKAYKDDNSASIMLVEGKVIANIADEQIEMKENQVLKYIIQSRKTELQTADPVEYISWKDGWLYCNSESIESIIKELSRYYDVTINIKNEEIKSMTLSGKLDLKDNCADILNIICQTAPLSYECINGWFELKAK